MNGHPRHPGTVELAEFRAGVTDGAHGDRIGAHLAECPDCASVSERLDEIPAVLAAIPLPAMPGNVETRIVEALAAEAARRESAAAAVPATTEPGVTSASPVCSSTAGSSSPSKAQPRAWWRSRLAASLGAVGAAAACLVLAFVSFRLSGTGHPTSPAAPGSGNVHAGPNIPASGAPGMRHDNLSPAHGPMQRTVPFVVVVSTTDFRQPTLRAQVVQQFPATASAGPSGHPSPGGGRWMAPSQSLVGCVMHLTGHATPAFVEEATYQSRPVYVVAVPDHAWVVARGCTSANPAVLASVALSPAG